MQPLVVLVLDLVFVEDTVEVVDRSRVALLEQQLLLALDRLEQTVALYTLCGDSGDLLLTFSLLLHLLVLSLFLSLDELFLLALLALLDCFKSLLHLVFTFVIE